MKQNLRIYLSTLLMLVCSVVGMAATGDTYKLVTNASELQSGDIVVIASGTNAMGKINSANTKIDPITVYISDDKVLSWVEGLGETILESTGSNWYIKFNGYYLNAVNNDRYGTSLNFTDSQNSSRGKWSLSISSDGTANFENTYKWGKKSLNYGSSFGFGGSGNVQIYKKQRRANELSFVMESYSVPVNTTTQVNFTEFLNNDNNLPITWSSSDTNVATIDANGAVTINKWGETTITATFAGNDTYAQGAVSMKFYVSALNPNISFLAKSGTLTLNNDGQKVPVSNPNNLPITYTSSTPYVATVDENGMLKLVSCGETTITATFAGDNVYGEGTATYKLTVAGNSGYDYTPVEFIAGTDKGNTTSIFNSDEMTKGNVTISSNNAAFASSQYKLPYNSSLKIEVNKGRIVRIEAEGDIKYLEQGSNGGGNYYKLSNSKHIWAGSSKIVSLKAVLGSTTENISAIRVYVEYPDEKTVVYNENGANTIEKWENTTVTLNRTFTGGQWNTICLPFDLSNDEIESVFGDNTKVVAYDSENDNTVQFKTTTNGIEAGKPYLIKPANIISTWTYENKDVKVEEPTAVGGNIQFQGIFSPKDITEGGTVTAAGVTAGGNIATAKQGSTTRAFRAYFTFANDVTVDPTALKLLIDGTPTAISSIDADTTDDANAPVYNMQGQRVSGTSLTKGVYIKNGRKFVVTK